MYLAARPGKTIAASEVARAFGVSANHMVKSLQSLCRAGLIRSLPGRAGGYVFEGLPAQIAIGDLVQQLEPNLDMAECFAPQTNTCPLTPECGLQSALGDAKNAFVQALNGYTLKDLVDSQPQKLWSIGGENT